MTRVRALDGLRGLAVAAVLLFHAELRHATGGFLGVSAFFTLSGFLITSLLLSEGSRTGTVGLGAFWARRARRLLPAAAVALAGILAFGAAVADADQLRDLRGDMLSALTYVANWRFYWDGRAYSELFSTPSPALHFWSLAIEEQFYLVFPLVVLAALRLGRGRLAPLAMVCSAGLIGSIALAFAFEADPTRVYFGTDTRMAELMVGALLAIVCTRRTEPRSRPARAALQLAGTGALTMLVFLWATVEQHDRWLYRGGFALHAALTAIVIAAAHIDSPVSRLLRARPLAALGLISYGVYLYHWPLFLWLSPERVDLPYFALIALRIAVTLACAIVSYRFLEQPIRRGDWLHGGWPRLLTPAAAAALVVALLAVTASPPPPTFELQAVAERAPVTPASVAPIPVAASVTTPAPAPASASAPTPFHRALDGPRPVRVMVVGDSVGLTIGRGLELYGLETGRIVVRNEARLWCSLARGAPRHAGYGESKSSKGCDDWATYWTRAIERFDPDVVVVAYTIWEIAPRRPPGLDDFVAPGDPRLDSWQRSEYDAAADVLGQRGAAIAWATVPCSEMDPSGPGSPIWFVNQHTIAPLDRARDDVRVIDLDAELCPRHVPRRAFKGVDPVRPDGRHFSDDGALALARWMMPIMFGERLPPATGSRPQKLL